MGIRVITTTHEMITEHAVKHRLLILSDDQHIVMWFREPIVNLAGNTPDGLPTKQEVEQAHNRAALALMGIAQAIYERAAKHLAENPPNG